MRRGRGCAAWFTVVARPRRAGAAAWDGLRRPWAVAPAVPRVAAAPPPGMRAAPASAARNAVARLCPTPGPWPGAWGSAGGRAAAADPFPVRPPGCLVAVGDRRSPPCIRRRRPGGEEARPSWSCVRSWSWSSRRALLVYLPHNGPAQCRIVLDPVQNLNLWPNHLNQRTK